MSVRLLTAKHWRPGIKQLELARNLLDNVKEQVQHLAESATDDQDIRKWITSVFRNWVQNQAPAKGWWTRRPPAGRKSAEAACAVISHYMPQLFPLNAQQVNQILVMKGTARFKNVVRHKWLAE